MPQAAGCMKRPRFASSERNGPVTDILKPLDGEVWPWPVAGEPGKGYLTNPEASSFFRTLSLYKWTNLS